MGKEQWMAHGHGGLCNWRGSYGCDGLLCPFAGSFVLVTIIFPRTEQQEEHSSSNWPRTGQFVMYVVQFVGNPNQYMWTRKGIIAGQRGGPGGGRWRAREPLEATLVWTLRHILMCIYAELSWALSWQECCGSNNVFHAIKLLFDTSTSTTTTAAAAAPVQTGNVVRMGRGGRFWWCLCMYVEERRGETQDRSTIHRPHIEPFDVRYFLH